MVLCKKKYDTSWPQRSLSDFDIMDSCVWLDGAQQVKCQWRRENGNTKVGCDAPQRAPLNLEERGGKSDLPGLACAFYAWQ